MVKFARDFGLEWSSVVLRRCRVGVVREMVEV
jgi:hypothetical protein